MKPDVLMLAAAIFIVGVLASGLGITEVFQSDPQPRMAEFQQGFVPAVTEAEEDVH